jgi:hypothetical protein
MKYIILLLITLQVHAQDIPYNQAQFKASHNSYAKKISIWDQIVVHKFNAIEFDLHTKKVLKGAPEGDWYVYHHLFDRKSQIKYLSDGLDILAKYQEEKPDHPILTVFIDMSGFNKNHSVEMFNKLLKEKLPNVIFSPTHLLKKCSEAKRLTEAVKKCGWPSLSELKGKIIFVLTKGDLNEYVEKSENPAAFVASKPKNKIEDSVFMNIAYKKEISWLDKLREKKIMTRFYFVDNKEEFKDSLKQLINFIAIDHVDSKKYPWQDHSN